MADALSRDDIVEVMIGDGAEPSIEVVGPAQIPRRRGGERFNIWETRVYYNYDPDTPFFPGQIAEAMRAAVAKVVVAGALPRARVSVGVELAASAGGRDVARSRTFITLASAPREEILSDRVWGLVRDVLVREDNYDKNDGIDFVDDIAKGAAVPQPRLAATAVVLKQYVPPDGGAMGLKGYDVKTAIGFFDVARDLCGQACLAYHEASTQVRRNMSRADRAAATQKKAEAMSKKIGHEGKMTIHDFEKYAAVAPDTRVVIFNDARETIFKTRPRTVYWRPLYLVLAGGHYYYVKKIAKIMKTSKDVRTRWCDACLKLVPSSGFNKHDCAGATCECCGHRFTGEDDKAAHLAPKPEDVKCGKCNQTLTFEGCVAHHKCPFIVCGECDVAYSVPKARFHQCGMDHCGGCNAHYPRGAPHRCYIQTLKPKPAKVHEYYAYDIESTIDANHDHAIALMVVTRLYGARGHVVLNGEAEVGAWLDAHMGAACTLVAHNGADYDAPLLFDLLVRRPGAKPHGLTFVGEKLLHMRYGKIRFIDSRRHIAGSLASLVRTFDLPTGPKGFFPYSFFTPERRWYVGEKPPAEAFAERDRARAGFAAWHAALASPYDINAECVSYCVQDAAILGRALEVYQTEMTAITGLDPLESVTIASTSMRAYRTRFMPPGSIPILTTAEHDFCRPGMKGGRTEAFQLKRAWTPEDVSAGKHAVYRDAVSLYPTVQRFDPLPGDVLEFCPDTPVADAGAFVAAHDGADKLAIVLYDIDPPPGLHLPVLLTKNGDGRLLGTLEPIRGDTGTSIELAKALELGYTGLKIHGYMSFAARRDLFAGYMDTLIALKDKFSPKGATPNLGRYKGTKLLMNSTWGKFGQRDPKCDYRLVTTTESWFKLVAQHNSGARELEALRGDESFQLASVSIPRKEDLHLRTTNIALASFVTAHGRLRLYAQMEKIGDRMLYCDTDSVCYEAAPGEYDVPVGAGLGAWSDETDLVPIVRYAALGPKTWAYRTAEGKGEAKCKGFRQDWASLEMYEAILDRVMAGNRGASESCPTLMFARSCKRASKMRTYMGMKRLSYTFNKRHVESLSCTLPLGHSAIPVG